MARRTKDKRVKISPWAPGKKTQRPQPICSPLLAQVFPFTMLIYNEIITGSLVSFYAAWVVCSG